MKIVCALLALGLGSRWACAQRVWTFDNGPEGWVVNDQPCSRPTGATIATYPVDWQATGGYADGFIRATDPSGNCFHFAAPVAALGNQSAVVGGELSFVLRSTLSDYDSESFVTIRGGGLTLVGLFEPLPTAAAWTAYRVRLVPASFRRDTLFGPQATAADVAAVFRAITVLRISAEFGSVVEETTSLDEVALVPPPPECPTDYNRDGMLNLDDLGDFITDFYTVPPPPGGLEPHAATYPDQAVGGSEPCPNAPVAPPPFAWNAYVVHGYRTGFASGNGSHCPSAPGQAFPNLDNLADFITAYYAQFGTDCGGSPTVR